MRSMLSFLFLVWVSVLQAQMLNGIDYDSSNAAKFTGIVSGNLVYGSSALTNSMLDPLVFGGFISNQVKENVQKNHKEFNVIGLEGNAFASLYFGTKTSNPRLQRWMPGVKYAKQYLASLVYPTTLYNLAFYGNDYFLGKYCNVSNTKLQYLDFQTLGFSVMDRKTQSTLSLNLVGMNNAQNAFLGENMNFYYTEAGDSLYGIVQGNWSQSKSPAYSKGLGASVDMNLRFPVTLNEYKYTTMELSIANLGFTVMNDYRTLTIDTSFAYGGYTISQLINREGMLAEGYAITDSLLVETTQKSKWMALPASIMLTNVLDLHKKDLLQPLYGFKMMLIAGYVPYVYGGLAVKLGGNVHAGLCASYGGFTGFKMNASVSVHAKNFNLGIASENVLGLMLKSGFGKSLQMRLRCDI